jgi:predicted extracellular nuclease
MAAFTPGNVVVYRVGTGSAALTSAATAVFLDEYTPGGVLVQSIALPTADSGANQTLTASGSQAEGFLNLSADGRYLMVTGYDAAVGTAAVAGTTGAAVNRIIGRIDANGTIDTSTAITAFSTGNIRSVASTDGSTYWAVGSTSGVITGTIGSSGTVTVAASQTGGTAASNLRAVDIFDGQLYVSAQTGSLRIGAVGTGTPTGPGNVIAPLPGIPLQTNSPATNTSPYQFFFADLTAAVPGVDTLYVTDDRGSTLGGGLYKFSLVGGSWVQNGLIAGSLRGLTGSVSSVTVTLYATTSAASANSIVSVVDTGGYNAAFSTTTLTTVATAAPNTSFRGIDFAPHAAAAPLPTLSIDDVTHTEGPSGTVTYTFTVSLSAASAGAVTFDIATADGTATTADGDYVAKSLTSQTIAAGLTTYTFDVTVNGDGTVEPNETFLVNVTNVSGATVADGQGQGTITNDDFPPVPTVSVGDASIAEGQSGVSYLTFTVTLSFAPTSTVTVDFATADGTATAGSDYLAVVGTVSFAAGQTTQTFTVPVIGDVAAEANETLTVNLTNPTGATLADAQGLGTITNDDASAYFPLASGNFSENWTDTSRITANDNWSGITSIVGYLGDTDPAGAVTGVDPRTITGPNLGQVDVIANLANTSSTSGGVGEFEIANPTIGLQGSGTADAPSIVLYMDASGRQDIHLTAKIRDIDASDDAAQQVNVQYRTGPTGTWTNVPGGYFADVTTGGSATQETSLDVILPAGANNSPTLEIRIMTTNAAGSDEWVGIDDINVSSVAGPASYSIADSAVFEGTGTTTPISFTVTRAGDTSAAGTVNYAVTFPGGGFSANAADFASPLTGSVSFNAGETSKTLTLDIVADSNPEADEAFTVTLSSPTAGGVLGDSSATGTIVNDDGAPPFVTISDVTQVEGNSGTSTFTFTVTRTGGTGAFTVDYATANGTATTADGDYQSTSGTLSFAAGENSKLVSVTVNGDTAGEFNETFSVNLSNPTGFAVLADPTGIGTIVNDDIIPIYMVQGSGMTSPFAGQSVRTQGIVTAIDSNGYYIQDPTGDGNSATSDGVFVFTSSAPAGVAIGDLIQVTGTVTEFVAGAGALSVTEIASPTALSVLTTGNSLPAAVIIGTGGILPPTENGPGNTFGNALAFYESMEGMRVTVQAPLVVQDTNSFGETWVLASGGAGATGVDSRGGITISAGDLNPERIQIDNDANLSPGYNPTHTQGDILANVTGIMNYANSSYEVLVTGTVTTTTDVTLPQETTTLHGDLTHLTVASYNVENLDLGDGQGKFDILAGNIVYNLLAPDIIALQEIQDADGPGNGADLSGTVTAQALIDAIKAIGGPNYVYIEIAPTTAGSTGGEPGGNIRNGFLYNADRVGLVAGSVQLIEDPAFSGSRRPLVASFTFNGSMVTLIDVHFTSRLGSDELEGSNQPPTDAGDTSRTAQGQAVRNYVNDHLATNPALKIGVFGDFNGFYFEGAVGALEAGGVMTDLHRLLPPEERYSYVFDGNSQAIDQAVVTQNLASGAQFDPVHLNSEYLANANRPTDHDPILASFLIPSSDGAINGTPGNDSPNGTAGNDLFNLSQGGNDTVNGSDGNDYIYFDGAFTAGDSVDGGAGTDTLALLGNYVLTFDADSLVNIERLALLSGTAIGGAHVTYDVTTIDENVGAGQVLTVLGGGLQSDETLVFNGSAETDGSFYVAGGAANDTLAGGQKNDALVGNGGNDTLYGMGGNDWLEGGAGADQMRGGFGSDLFVYKSASDSTAAASDHIVDFEDQVDLINLVAIDADTNTAGDQAFSFIGTGAFTHTAGELRIEGSGSNWFVQGDIDGDGIADLVIQVDTFRGYTLQETNFML